MKINRREHLKQLGLGAAGMLGAGLFANDLSVLAKANPLLRLKARAWPWSLPQTVPFDDNPGIRMYFLGMMVFTYKARQGRVVFHTTSPNHTLQILAFDTNACGNPLLKKEGTQIPSKIELINPPGHPDDVLYFAKNPDNFDRKAWHCKDFRWLLDLEGPEIYSDKDFLRTEGKGFNKKLFVSSGLFYTYLRTTSMFTTDVGSLGCSNFSIARIMACDIPLMGQETFVLKVGGDKVEMSNPNRYELYFLNLCQSCSHTSDFPMVFDAIEDEADYKFDLTRVGDGPPCTAPDAKCLSIMDKGTDEAPCMGAGFGGGRGFPG